MEIFFPYARVLRRERAQGRLAPTPAPAVLRPLTRAPFRRFSVPFKRGPIFKSALKTPAVVRKLAKPAQPGSALSSLSQQSA